MTVNRDDFSLFFSQLLRLLSTSVHLFFEVILCFFILVFNIWVFKLRTFNCIKISNLELAGHLYLLQVLVDAT